MADSIVTDEGLVALLQEADQARERALALVDLAALSNNATAAADDGAAGRLLEIARQQKYLMASIAQLRSLHRSACFAARDTKAKTAEARHEVDRLHLQLQNLYYEQKHLQGEISACENYSHSYMLLPLIPEEEFLEAHPEHADDDETALMTARIEHERREREALEQQRNELLKKKLKLIAENNKRKEDLANLDKDLENFIDAAKPIQNLFERVA